MGQFTIRNIGTEPNKPEGDHLWRFKLVGSDETTDVPADTPYGAWKAIRFEKEADWKRWILYGRADLVDDGCTSLMVSAQFAQAYPNLVKRWDESDTPEDE